MRTMKTLLTLAATLTLAGLATPATAGDGKAYGKALTKEAKAVTVAELVDSPEKYVGERVRVKGVVTDVYTHRGCWIKIGGEDGKTVRFKVQDGEIVFPVETKGQRCDAEGVWTKQVVSKEKLLEQGKHHAKREGKPFDPASVTGPQTFYQLKGLGAVLE